MSVCVCVLVHGAPAYFETGRETCLSVLKHSVFDVFAAHGEGDCRAFPQTSRLHLHPLAAPLPSAHRAHRFLRKFSALQACLAAGRHDWIVSLDADTVLVRSLDEARLRHALGTRTMGMVEQTTVTGSAMNRGDFFEHYRRHSLALLDPSREPPAPGAFRYFNSGVVVAARAEWERLLPWALDTIRCTAGEHQVGEHMIADQDYFQYWANSLHPGRCAELPWMWNHCEFWDSGFPRLGAQIAHFSNFCQGPAAGTVARMRALYSSPRQLLHAAAGRWRDRFERRPRS